MIPRKYREFAKAYFTIAVRDIQRAKQALSLKDYPECFFYSQQSVEKSVKAMLEVKLVFKKEHELVVEASNYLQELGKDLDTILDALDYLSGGWSISRYPVINGQDIKTPEEIITEEMCRQGIDYSEKVLKIAESFLRKYGII
jgi:HEPN domain-containing protein